jgi:Novel toxin 15
MEEAAAGTRAAEQATRELRNLNATHALDLVAGGDGSISGLGDASINKSIGAQWRGTRAAQLRRAAEEARKKGKDKMDVELKECPPGSNSSPSGDGGGSGGGSTTAPGQGVDQNIPMS